LPYRSPTDAKETLVQKTLAATATAALLTAGAVLAQQAATPVPSATPSTPASNPQAEEAKGLIKSFAGTLKGELEAAMKAGGPTQAIKVCKERAPAIAKDISTKSGWDVGRTSLKTRNTELNAPDDWERAVLNRFDERRAAGEPADSLAFGEVVEVNGTRQFRFMKAIPTGDVCLACHGTQIAPEVAAALDDAYPGDQARGYTIGDVRGAFSLSKAQ
jgi:hypothetical protein